MLRTSILLACCAIFVRTSASAQSTVRASVDSAGVQGNGNSVAPSITADGRYVAFVSGATNLVVPPTNGIGQIFVHDTQTGATTIVSVSSAGTPDDSGSRACSVSADGLSVAFESDATNLVTGDANLEADIFVHDRQTGLTTRVSVDSSGAEGNLGSHNPAISPDGRYVAFVSSATNLVPGDTNGSQDIFVHDRQTGTTVRVSVDSAGGEGNSNSYGAPSMSADGRYVAFFSTATNLVPGDTNGFNDVFVHDIRTGATTRVSVDSAGAQGNANTFLYVGPALSADGRYVAFQSSCSNLALGDTNGVDDLFVHDCQSGATTRVSVDSAGAQGNARSFMPSLSADGRFVAFASEATNLVAGDTNGINDVFVHDNQTGATTRVSVDSAGMEANASSLVFFRPPAISADGRYVAFQSFATNLVTGDTNGAPDVFVHDRGQAAAFTSFCFGDGLGAPCPCANTGNPGHGCENSGGTGGALLGGTGSASLSADSVVFTSTGELVTALSIVLQGDTLVAPASFGDGLRCAGGVLKRLYVKSALGGTIRAPQVGDQPVSARSAALGDTIPLGSTRAYQVYYRDSNLGFCPAGFNATNAIAIAWGS